MRFLKPILILSLLFCGFVHAEEETSNSEKTEACGQFQIEDFGDQIFFWLMDFSHGEVQTVIYNITNRENTDVKSMVTGLCYCTLGQVDSDPRYQKDPAHKLLNVTRIMRGPFSDCGPKP